MNSVEHFANLFMCLSLGGCLFVVNEEVDEEFFDGMARQLEVPARRSCEKLNKRSRSLISILF